MHFHKKRDKVTALIEIGQRSWIFFKNIELIPEIYYSSDWASFSNIPFNWFIVYTSLTRVEVLSANM